MDVSDLAVAPLEPHYVARFGSARPDDIAALRAERRLDGVIEDIDAAQHSVARVGGEAYESVARKVRFTCSIVLPSQRASWRSVEILSAIRLMIAISSGRMSSLSAAH